MAVPVINQTRAQKMLEIKGSGRPSSEDDQETKNFRAQFPCVMHTYGYYKETSRIYPSEL